MIPAMLAKLIATLGLAMAVEESATYAARHGHDDVQYHYTVLVPGEGTGACTVMVWTNGNPAPIVNRDYTSLYVNDDDDDACARVDAEFIRCEVTATNAIDDGFVDAPMPPACRLPATPRPPFLVFVPDEESNQASWPNENDRCDQ